MECQHWEAGIWLVYLQKTKVWRQGVNAKQITCPLSVYLREGGVGPRLLQKCELLAKQFSTWSNDAKHRRGLVLSLGSLAESDVGQPVAWRF